MMLQFSTYSARINIFLLIQWNMVNSSISLNVAYDDSMMTQSIMYFREI